MSAGRRSQKQHESGVRRKEFTVKGRYWGKGSEGIYTKPRTSEGNEG